MRNQPRPCKFGQKCNQWKQGTCTFLHDQGPSQNWDAPQYQPGPRHVQPQGPNGYQGPQGQQGSTNNRPKPPCRNGLNCNNWKQGRCNFLHDQAMNGGGNGNYMNGPQSDQGGRGGRGSGNYMNGPQSDQGGRGGRGGRGGGSNQPQHDNQSSKDISFQFCKFFHLNNDCNKGQQCKRLHKFTKDDRVRRSLVLSDLPRHTNSRLGKFNNSEQKYLALREDRAFTFFQYDPLSSTLTNIINTDFMIPEGINCHYYDAKDGYLFFAFEDASNKLTSIGSYEIISTKVHIAQGAHQREVSAMTTITIGETKYILSGSRDGTIKAWIPDAEGKLNLNQGISDSFKNCYHNGAKLEIMYLSIENIEGSQVLVAGTSDSRVLFWIGLEMTYKQIVFEGPCNKVLTTKFFKSNGNWYGVTLSWSQDNKIWALFGIVISDFSYQVMANDDPPNIRNMLLNIECTNDMLFAYNMNGLLTIFEIPSFNKVGCMMFNNPVVDVVLSKTTTQTNIDIQNLFVLEKKSDNKPGSLQIFVLS